ncbi:MAG: hypothetical protein GX992_05835, partial [Clostridium sp.]|nr:hypothetical protein [Clostridium sp.]
TGTYGAGKSTLIQSYEKQSKKEKFVYISLARFGEDCSKDEDSSNNNNQTHETPKKSLQTLENKVINQLIHSVAPHRIPKTRFLIKKEISSRKRLIIKAFLTVLPLLLLYHIKFNYLKDYIDTFETQDSSVLLNVLSFIANEWVLFFTGILLVAASLYLVNVLITFLESNKILAKFSLGGNAIEVFAAADDSNFDRYLDELLYIIECSQAKVFVFEDIDRFKSSEIFVRLREINQLVNQRLSNDISKNGCRSSQNKHPRVIRFFYMMRDDLFTCKDRTKFFDFIIPVVPIIVATNSYEQLAKMLNASNLKEQFDDYFLRDISLYIDDMRVLKNIVNEYQIYSEQLRERPRLDCNKLFALISYKNLYPEDFTKLQCSQGPVYDLFAWRKSQFVVEEVNSLNERIKSLNSELEELLAHEQEAAATGTVPVSSTAIAEYEDYPDIHQELEKLINKKNKMETSKLHELINEDNENEMLGCLQPLIKYLIRQGYLDETYADYMSYFIGESNTPRDHQFLRSVTDRQAEEFDYQLDYPERILVDLNPAYFGNVETLNNALLDYILENESK